VFTLLAATVGLAAYANWRPGFRDPVFDAKVDALADRFGASREPLRVLALGSSRTSAAVEPRALEAALAKATGRPVAAFNLGVPGSGPVCQLIHYGRLRETRPRPDLVVVELLPAAFAWRNDRPYDAAVLRPDRISRAELDTVCQSGFPSAETRAGWEHALLNPWFGLRFQVLGRLKPRWLPPGVSATVPANQEPDGWAPWDPLRPDAARSLVANVRRVYEPQLRAARFDGPHAEAFERLLGECRADGLRVAVVLPPEGSEFRSWYPSAVERALREYVERLRSELGIPVIDARAWLPDDAFADTHHVLRGWAGPYTERLAREAVLPALGASVLEDR
jgi:hypothetical protein